MADALANLAKSPVTRLSFDDGDHNDFYSAGGAVLLAALGRFVDECGGAVPPSR